MKIRIREHENRIGREFEANRQRICETLHALTTHFDKKTGPDRLLETQVMLESIPLSHGEFKLATRRVTNACRFVHSGEIGPAKYELQMLLGMLDELGSLIRRRQLVKPPLPPKTRLNESWSVAFSG